MTLGSPASLSPKDARIEAHKIKGQAAAGANPAAEKKAKAVEFSPVNPGATTCALAHANQPVRR